MHVNVPKSCVGLMVVLSVVGASTSAGTAGDGRSAGEEALLTVLDGETWSWQSFNVFPTLHSHHHWPAPYKAL